MNKLTSFRRAKYVAPMGDIWNVHRILDGKSKRMRPLIADLGVNERIISKLISISSLYESIDWNHMTKNRDKWQVFVKTAKNPRDPYTVFDYLRDC